MNLKSSYNGYKFQPPVRQQYNNIIGKSAGTGEGAGAGDKGRGKGEGGRGDFLVKILTPNGLLVKVRKMSTNLGHEKIPQIWSG